MRSINNEVTGEPALYAALVSAGVQLAAAFWLPWDNAQVTLVNAAVMAIAGVVVAFQTRATDNGGSVKAAILGAVQALMSLGLGFGWHATDAQTAALMSFVGLVVAVFIRQTSKPKGAYGLAA